MKTYNNYYLQLNAFKLIIVYLIRFNLITVSDGKIYKEKANV